MLKKIIKKIIENGGYKLSPIAEDGWSKGNLRKPGLSPSIIFDVGVHSGTPELYNAFPDAYYVLIDPLSENEHYLQEILGRLKGEYLLKAAGAAPGVTKIHVEPSFVGRSSILERTKFTSTGDVLEERSISVTTLDEIKDTQSLSGPFGIKIDTEGFELEVIRGARNVMKDTQFVIVEVSVSKRFKGGYDFADMINEMKGNGFHLSDVLSVVRSQRSGEAMFMDVLFRPDKDDGGL